MVERGAEAKWSGKLKDGEGYLKLNSGLFEGPFSFSSRFEEGEGTNPEELIGAAHAGCFSMALSLKLEESGNPPKEINTEANVKLKNTEEGFRITEIVLDTEGKVPGLEEGDFAAKAEEAKEECPVSQALAGTKITLKSKLIT